MAGELKVPKRGEAARALQELGAEHAPPSVDAFQDRNVTDLQEILKVNEKESKTESRKVSQGDDLQESKPENLPGSERSERLARAMAMVAEDEFVVVSVRVPKRLNSYLDAYVGRMKGGAGKRRYLKQDAMAEALAGFMADHPMPPEEDYF